MIAWHVLRVFENYQPLVVPASMFVALGFYGLLTTASELENPLGWDVNDIDLTSFRDIIGVELMEVCRLFLLLQRVRQCISLHYSRTLVLLHT